MPLDLHPIYHTETMVKILRDQGSPQLATELAEQVLQGSPGHLGVQQILSELREEARLAFERFKNSGRAVQEDAQPSTPEISVSSEPELTTTSSDASRHSIPDGPYAEKALKLQMFLDRIKQRQSQDENH